MSSRAIIIVIDRGRHQLFGHTRLAKDIPSFLFPGLETVRRGLDSCEVLTDWIDDIAAEGAVLMDLERKILQFWGGEDIEFNPGLRRTFLGLLQMTWAGWRILWAEEGLVSIASAAGCSLAGIIKSPKPELPSLDPRFPLENENNPVARTFVTLIDANGCISDRVVKNFSVFLLARGPEIVKSLPSKETSRLPNESENVRNGLLINIPTHDLWTFGSGEFFNGFGTVDRRCERAIEDRWLGWKAHVHADGIARQLEISGRDPTPCRIDPKDALVYLRKVLSYAPESMAPDPLPPGGRVALFDKAAALFNGG